MLFVKKYSDYISLAKSELFTSNINKCSEIKKKMLESTMILRYYAE